MQKNYPELGILSASQIWGDEASSPLGIFDKYTAECIITDLAVVTGCDIVASGDSTRRGWSYTSTPMGKWAAFVLSGSGEKTESYRKRHDGAVRPCFRSEELFSSLSDGKISDEAFTVVYGEYPQSAADAVTAAQLNKAQRNGTLALTGKTYTFCGNTFKEKQNHKFIEKYELVNQTFTVEELHDVMAAGMTFQSYGEKLRHGDESMSEDFLPEEISEYSYNGEKYICIESRPKELSKKFTLSNGIQYLPGDAVWIKVEPVAWYVDAKEKLFVSEKCLISGIRLQKRTTINKFSFADCELNQYLNSYMAHDLFEVSAVSDIGSGQKKSAVNTNPYGFDFAEASEEDIIRGCIESGVPVFLHGASSEGKSARVKQIDPDCVIIYMRNATPDSLNGKSIVNQSTGEMTDIKPTWLKKLEAICEKEPDKHHVIFFDELTNALPSIQGSAFNIVLDREVNGMWKLPENARLVAAGNELNDSLAAYQLAEPLFNRFAHVYIHTELDAWLRWAADNYIHPSIYAYIACNNGAPLRSEYDGHLPNADPRKWEMASKILYSTGRPEMIRCLVGEDITADFCSFCKMRIVTPEEVISGLKPEDCDLSETELKNSVLCLSQVDAEHMPQIREFVKALGYEYCASFDNAWAHNEYSRLEVIAALRRMERADG